MNSRSLALTGCVNSYTMDQSLVISGESKLENTQALERFLASVERRAFSMARFATGNTDDALDIVQDAMFKLAEKYASRNKEEWGPLFTRVLQSRIYDFHRRNKVRNRFRSWLGFNDDEATEDPMQNLGDEKIRDPEQLLQSGRRIDILEKALEALPTRQQQAFLLRVWEGLDVRETARAMSCSEGSVKTHYFRAVHSLREELGEHWS